MYQCFVLLYLFFCRSCWSQYSILVYPSKGEWVHTFVPSHASYFHTPSQGSDIREAPFFVGKVVMTGFAGLEDSESSTLQAMIDFTYHSTMGNMDQAFKAIKFIKR